MRESTRCRQKSALAEHGPWRSVDGAIPRKDATPYDASVALHEKLGFRKGGQLERIGWKLNRWIDVGYWQLQLGDE